MEHYRNFAASTPPLRVLSKEEAGRETTNHVVPFPRRGELCSPGALFLPSTPRADTIRHYEDHVPHLSEYSKIICPPIPVACLCKNKAAQHPLYCAAHRFPILN